MNAMQEALAALIKSNPAILNGIKMNGRSKKKVKAKGRVKLTDEQKATYKAANDVECIKVFTAAGYTDVQPRINVLTYGKDKDGVLTGWISQGRRVKKGEKAFRVNGLPLFHINQTESTATA